MDIISQLVDEKSSMSVLSELKSYCLDSEPDYVKKSIRAIGKIALKLKQSSEQCVLTLIELIETKSLCSAQESIIVMKV